MQNNEGVFAPAQLLRLWLGFSIAAGCVPLFLRGYVGATYGDLDENIKWHYIFSAIDYLVFSLVLNVGILYEIWKAKHPFSGKSIGCLLLIALCIIFLNTAYQSEIHIYSAFSLHPIKLDAIDEPEWLRVISVLCAVFSVYFGYKSIITN